MERNICWRPWMWSREISLTIVVHTEKMDFLDWMNQIDIWFGIITRKVIRRGNFKSTQELDEKLMAFIEYANQILARPYR